MNVKKHFKKDFKKDFRMVNPTGNPYGDLASTVHHELLHVKHPSMSETKIRKKEKRDMKRMGKAQKVRLLDKLR